MSLEQDYHDRFERVLTPIAEGLSKYLKDVLSGVSRIDQIGARAKSVERFLAKAETMVGTDRKYDDPLTQIQDQIGGRVVTFYLSDVERIATEINKYFRPIEDIDVVPDSETEFSYFGKHYIVFIPTDAIPDGIDADDAPDFCELQIKTLYQHAWSEANHDLGYKPTSPLDPHDKRRIAFTSAQSWGADQIFDELHRTLQDESG